MTSAAQAALAELVRRREVARKAIEHGQWTISQAEDRIKPWAAIAILCGADVPPLRLILRDEAERCRRSWPDFDSARIERVSRALVALDLDPDRNWVAQLSAARDRALDRFTERAAVTDAETDQAITLTTIANFLGLPCWRPKSLVEQLTERAAA